jgi:hypothetical protein
MQPLQKNYGLITYLTCTIYSYDKKKIFEFYSLFLYLSNNYWKKNCKLQILQFIYISIQMMI